MPLRLELVVGPPNPTLVARLAALAEVAINAFWPDPHSTNHEALAAIQEIRNLTNNSEYEPFTFHALPGVEETQDFAERAALGPPPLVPDLRRDEIIDLLERATAVRKPYSDYYLAMLMRNFPYASPSDLIYWPDRERTCEEMADEILHRKEVFETGGVDAVRLHILALANAVVANPASPLWAREWAKGVLGASVIAMPPK